MLLRDYLTKLKLTSAEFGKRIGVGRYSVERYARHERIPERAVMRKIFRVTDGLVSANDFYDLANG